MNIHPLICPVCGNDLIAEPGRLVCTLRHSFDIAREGYVNLLPPRRDTARVPGDPRSMVRARRNFLDHGHYEPLAELIAGLATDHLAGNPGADAVGAEIGSGEGYFIGRVRQRAEERKLGPPRCLGMDISRDAVRMAAKRYPEITFFAADVWEKVLFRDGSVRVLLDVLAPRNPAEFARVLEPGGMLVVAIPGERHLEELRRDLPLLGIEPGKQEQVEKRLSGAFRLEQRRTLEYTMSLTGDELRDLVEMTPNYWHVATEDLERLRGRGRRITASFRILKFVK